MLNTIEEAIDAIKNGELIIVVDDEDRENEGDFIGAAELITPEKINFMATIGRGLICAPIKESRAEELGLMMMVNQNTAMHETAFTVSIDLKNHGCTTGISAYDRATGIRALTDQTITSEDFAKPGHIFPLKAKNGGVLRRTGHTEAAVDFAEMAGLYPAGVLVEILNEDGSMARLPELKNLAIKHNLKIVSINDLVAYRLKHEVLVHNIGSYDVKSPLGELTVTCYSQSTSDDEHLALKWGDWTEDEVVPVRVMSENYLHELPKVLFTDWYQKFDRTIQWFQKAQKGLLVIMRHKEKVPDLINSLERLVSSAQIEPRSEQRDFGIGAQIIRDQNVRKINLLTSSNIRRVGINGYGLEIVDTTMLD